MYRKARICVVGSLNVEYVTTTPRFPNPGETLTATSLTLSAGGKGGIQAAACGRATTIDDVYVNMIGAVRTDDPHYEHLLQPSLEDSGVDTTSIEQLKDVPTGSASIIVDEANGGEKRVLVVPGANHAGILTSADKIIKTIQSYPSPTDVVVLQGEIPRATTVGLLKFYNDPEGRWDSGGRAKVVFNPSPVYPKGIPYKALLNTAVLIMNETELMQMSRCNREWVVDESDSVERLARKFHLEFGVGIVLVTLGAKGVYYSARMGRAGVVPGVEVDEVVDTTAAGDTFVGYFANSLARFLSTGHVLEDFDDVIEDAVILANDAAALSVQVRGGMRSVPFA
ncbi:Ribokinase [Penicillium psychrosexuale]|uniref:Ribokinase n=1 Tax=Penicillium psychrosexuale TaxID=1002107 RepID=UPI002545814C|nr:Ribokinase [Penicillium psychrosexuale]KAJ5801634.1 Ribokinase [Penicillium psychrosexuale]